MAPKRKATTTAVAAAAAAAAVEPSSPSTDAKSASLAISPPVFGAHAEEEEGKEKVVLANKRLRLELKLKTLAEALMAHEGAEEKVKEESKSKLDAELSAITASKVKLEQDLRLAHAERNHEMYLRLMERYNSVKDITTVLDGCRRPRINVELTEHSAQFSINSELDGSGWQIQDLLKYEGEENKQARHKIVAHAKTIEGVLKFVEDVTADVISGWTYELAFTNNAE